MPSQATLDDAVRTLDGIARFDKPAVPVFVRVGEHDGDIYIDLGTDDRSIVKVTRDGWSEVAHAPVKVRRPEGLRELPHFERGGSIDELRPFLNVPDEASFLLVVAWCIAAFRPAGLYAIPILIGEQGTAKSTTTRFLRSLVDPKFADIRPMSRDVRDLAIAASNGHVLAFDNLSGISPDMSDALCRLATGGGFSTRRLYSDDEEILINVSRPVILNGIEQPASRGDVLDHAIVIDLPLLDPKQRITERELDAAFARARPRLLGVLLDAVALALGNEQAVALEELPRLADFVRFTAAAAPALGLPETAFLDAYRANKRAAQVAALDGDAVGVAIVALVREVGGSWYGPAQRLLEDLNRRRVPGPTPFGWPTTPRAMSGALKRLAPMLRSDGVEVEMGERSAHERRIVIWDAALLTNSDATGGARDDADGDHQQPSHQQSPCLAFDDGRDGDDGGLDEGEEEVLV